MFHLSTAGGARSVRRPAIHRLAVAWLAVMLLATMPISGAVSAAPPAYGFTHVATLDTTPAPGGGTFTFGFEPYAINSRGVFAFVANPSTGGQGVYTGQPGQLREVFRDGQAAPGGGTFSGFGSLGHSANNDAGDVAVGFTLLPFSQPPPLGVNAGVYRHTKATNTLSAVIVPNVTPAPEGGTFQGTGFHASINNRGDVVFPGIVPTQNGIRVPGEDYLGLGLGIFRADKKGQIVSLVSSGDVTPGSGRFDYLTAPWVNDRGDVAFGAHVAGEECIRGIDSGTGQPFPQNIFLACFESVYLRLLHPTRIISIAHQGQDAPGGGTFRLAFGPRLNNRGEVAFIGDLTPAPGALEKLGVFLYLKGTSRAIARPGDLMPGGGIMMTASTAPLAHHLNNRGDVSFAASLDTNNDSVADAAGLYVSGQSGLKLVARTGTVVQLPATLGGPGTIAHLSFPSDTSLINFAGAVVNDNGQILFQATLTDGRGVLLIAGPQR